VAGVVFGDDDRLGGKEWIGGWGAQVGEDAVVFGFVGVRGVNIDEVERG